MSTPNTIGTWVRRGSLTAGICYTATAEYELARRLGAVIPVAVMLPLAIDFYVIAALRWFRAFDVALSLMLMGAAQVAAHALEAGVVQVDLNLVAVVSLLVPIALWRTHALARQTPQDATLSATVPPVPDQTPSVPEPVEYTLDRDDEQDAPETPQLPPGTGQDAVSAIADTPVLLTSKDVADRFGVDPSTVRSWVANGTLTVHDKTPRGHNLFHPDKLPQEART
ncbi:hypothetical protein [Streptomyces canus]|uniref:hypothetical protein n=1 Tax=Streptomyces canus TaxID=58343 RepID=UPI00039AFC93|nr:hypothetical protein [Streptomyces canus]